MKSSRTSHSGQQLPTATRQDQNSSRTVEASGHLIIDSFRPLTDCCLKNHTPLHCNFDRIDITFNHCASRHARRAPASVLLGHSQAESRPMGAINSIGATRRALILVSPRLELAAHSSAQLASFISSCFYFAFTVHSHNTRSKAQRRSASQWNKVIAPRHRSCCWLGSR